MNKMTPEELEKFVHQQLRGLPSRRAPRTLESRVLAAIEQRALIPWYHQSWSHWPAAVRSLFLVLATTVTSAVIGGFYVGFTGASTSSIVVAAGQKLGLLAKAYHVALWIVDLCTQMVGRIPSLWLYGGLTAIALCYATFFGLGAAAYRTLYRNN